MNLLRWITASFTLAVAKIIVSKSYRIQWLRVQRIVITRLPAPEAVKLRKIYLHNQR